MSGDPPDHSDEFAPDARNAMRAFLQRCEVRLSTMHRIANAFLSGAGLLLFIPVFSGASTTRLLGWLMDRPSTYSAIPLSVALLIIFYIPLWSYYLLLRDLTRFYFVVQLPSYSRLFAPAFALTGLAFPRDEGEESGTKAKILRALYTAELIDFIVPPSDDAAGLDHILYAEGGVKVQPATRTLAELKEHGIIESDTQHGTIVVEGNPTHTLSITRFDRINTALVCAGLYDRTLHQEVANIEAALVRHNLALHRIVISYVRSLLTIVSLFLMLFFIGTVLGASDEISTLQIAGLPADELLVAMALMVWALIAAVIVRSPFKWIYTVFDPRSAAAHMVPVKRDISLVAFEGMVVILCGAVFIMISLYVVIRVFWSG